MTLAMTALGCGVGFGLAFLLVFLRQTPGAWALPLRLICIAYVEVFRRIPFLVVIYLVLYLIVFVTCVVALVDLLLRPAQAFVTAGKRTRSFWLVVLLVATAVAFVALPWPIGIGRMEFLALGAAVAGIVYLVDVRPAIAPYSGRRGGRGPRGPQRGGW